MVLGLKSQPKKSSSRNMDQPEIPRSEKAVSPDLDALVYHGA